ncbi:MAG: hypothetical protein ACFFBD_28375, partial [Candidatus Hodarchaeota archaeon]
FENLAKYVKGDKGSWLKQHWLDIIKVIGCGLLISVATGFFVGIPYDLLGDSTTFFGYPISWRKESLERGFLLSWTDLSLNSLFWIIMAEVGLGCYQVFSEQYNTYKKKLISFFRLHLSKATSFEGRIIGGLSILGLTGFGFLLSWITGFLVSYYDPYGMGYYGCPIVWRITWSPILSVPPPWFPLFEHILWTNFVVNCLIWVGICFLLFISGVYIGDTIRNRIESKKRV